MDLSLLEKAVNTVGLVLNTEQKTFVGQYIGTQRCEATIVSHTALIAGGTYGAYVIKNSDGSYSIQTDKYNNPILEHTGKNFEKLLQEYAFSVAYEDMLINGYALASRKLDEQTGEMVVEFEKLF